MFKPRKFVNLITSSAFGNVRAALAIRAPAAQTHLTKLRLLSHTWALLSESGKKPRHHHQNPCSWSSLIRKKLRSASKSTWPKADVGLSARPRFQSSAQQWNHHLPGCLHQKPEPSSTSCFLSSHSPALNPSAYSAILFLNLYSRSHIVRFSPSRPPAVWSQPHHCSPALLSRLPQGLLLLLSPLQSFL